MMFHFQNKKTFTLIEMLVVVVIIGILAGVLVPRLMGAKERASDSARIVKVGQISSAVELYAQETGSPYPIATLTGAPGISIATPIVTNAIAPYLSSIPTDPGKGTLAILNPPSNIQVTGDSFAYWTNDAGTGYAITALMESKKGNTTNSTEVIDSDKQGSYQKVGKGLTTSITPTGGGGGGDCTTPVVGVNPCGTNNIMVSDGTPANTYVIADRNVGATEAGTDGTNAAIRGSYFQWGNNFGFSSDPTVTLSPSSTTQVNTNGLTTYMSSTWIYGMGSAQRYDWSITQNNNLRQPGAQGPCDPGYHVPTYTERQSLYNIWLSLYPGQGSNGGLFRDTLKLPMAGLRGYGSAASVYDQGDYGYYWSSTPDYSYADGLCFGSSGVDAGYYDNRAYGFSVRCFENSQ